MAGDKNHIYSRSWQPFCNIFSSNRLFCTANFNSKLLNLTLESLNKQTYLGFISCCVLYFLLEKHKFESFLKDMKSPYLVLRSISLKHFYAKSYHGCWHARGPWSCWILVVRLKIAPFVVQINTGFLSNSNIIFKALESS